MRCIPLGVVLVLFLLGSASADRGGPDIPDRIPVVDGPGVMLTSNSSSLVPARETAGPDTFVLYGGPGNPTEGKFQLSNRLTADWGGGNGLPGGYGGGPDAWTPVDNTDQPVFWHLSQFNAQTLGTSQPSPNHAMWSGLEIGDPRGSSWEHLPGYGNVWNDGLLYESDPLIDTSTGQTVALDFYFHHDTEPGFDLFNVEYDSAGKWVKVLSVDASNKDASNNFAAPGLQFSAVQHTPIYYVGNDYGGENFDQISIRMTVTSDGAWSDQDGLWQTTAGAAQVDQITMTTSQGSFTEDYETTPGPQSRYLFQPDKAPFAGDFADVYPQLTTIDPCRQNITPVVGFIDYGQVIRNGPGLGGETSIIGGSTSPGINYGITGNYVVNHTGGLSFGEVSLRNEIWSPAIAWDLPGSADDGAEVGGAFIRYTEWEHLPIPNGIFSFWQVRSALSGEDFGAWKDYNFFYYPSGIAHWSNYRADVSSLLEPAPERVQMALVVIDYADVLGFPGTASTPAPVFDNAAFYKYRIGGPTFATRTIDTAQDGFPISGSVDVSTPAARGGLDIPFSMARDINTGDQFNEPGDSIVVDVASAVPGATVVDVRMVWALGTNALFEDALRTVPARVKDESVVAGAAGTVWTGEVVADTSRVSNGAIVADRFFFDLPDVDFMYPGDILHYYVQAIDSDGRTTTWPANVSGFMDFTPTTTYKRSRTVRGLPTITDTSGTHPELLVWNDFGRRGGENEWTTGFQQLGYLEGVHYDTYTTQGPTSGVSNGLGSAGVHGAAADQLAGYEHMFYFGGNLSTYLLSNGSNQGNNDKGDDIGLMEQWHALPGTRNCAYFGDYIATALLNDSPEGLAYVGSPMGIAYGDEDVRDVIGDQTAPLIVPNVSGTYAAYFSTSYVAYGGCLSINEFDQILPAAGASSGHLFTDAGGTPIPPSADPSLGGVASVINPTLYGLDVTFPYASFFVYDIRGRAVNLSARTQLFGEILGLFNAVPGGAPVAAPKFQPAALNAFPNPFNPVTVVSFTAPIGSRGSVKVFNLRGELVRTLHSGEFVQQEFRWDGIDDRGASVASGVYVIKAEAEGKAQTKKVALVK